jgi:hypothetical protein
VQGSSLVKDYHDKRSGPTNIPQHISEQKKTKLPEESFSDSNESVQSELGRTHPIPRSSINCTKDFFIASAYFTLEYDTVKVEISSAHKAWVSDTPYVQPICRVQSMSRILITKKHYSYCLPFPMLPTVNGDELEVTIEDQGVVRCSFLARRLIRTPSRFTLMAMTVVRNPLYLREWTLYHLGQGFQHLVIYDDSSTTAHVSSLVSDFVISGNVTVVDWSHAGFHRSRQFTAMQDFALRFSAASEWVLNLDDDCFFPEAGPQSIALKDLLDSSLREGFAQVRVAGAWYGACATEEVALALNLSVGPCLPARNASLRFCPVLDARGCPLHALFSGRTYPVRTVAWLPSVASDRGARRQYETALSFVHTGEPFAASATSHEWAQLGPRARRREVDPGVYHYRHLKLLDYARHRRKAAHGSWETLQGQGGLGQWLRLNRGMCREHDPAPDARALLGSC